MLLAGLYADGADHGDAPGRVPRSQRADAEELRGAGRTSRACAPRFIRRGGSRAQSIEVPGDFSSAAFFIVAGLLGGAGEGLLLQNVGMNPTRTGLLEILRRMGADIEIMNPRESGAEPVADLRVRRLGAARASRCRRNWCRWRSMNFRCCSSPPPAPRERPWSPARRNCASRKATESPR